MDIKEAEKLFKKYRGSLFGMGYDEINKYREYKSLNISREMEQKWRKEIIEELFSSLEKEEDYHRRDTLSFSLAELIKQAGTDKDKERLLNSQDSGELKKIINEKME